MCLLSFAKHTNRIVGTTARAGTASITLYNMNESAAPANFQAIFPGATGTLLRSQRTLDFFNRQRSQALHTRLRIPSEECE